MNRLFVFDAQQTFHGYRDDEGGREPVHDDWVVLYTYKRGIWIPLQTHTKLSRDLPYFPRIAEIITQVKRHNINTLCTFDPWKNEDLGFKQDIECEDISEFYSELSENNHSALIHAWVNIQQI